METDDLKLSLDYDQAVALNEVIDREQKLYSSDPSITPVRITTLRLLQQPIAHFVSKHS
jgi:hypothetical protein